MENNGTITGDILAAIAAGVQTNVEHYRGRSNSLPFVFTPFHGFQKSLLPDEVVQPVLSSFGVTSRDVQIEVAGVLEDLTHEIHSHHRTEAHITCIGEDFGLPNPRDAYAFLAAQWIAMGRGHTLHIPVDVEHGFTVDPGGVVYFLSVQSPPIISPDGQEDYIVRPFTRWSRRKAV